MILNVKREHPTSGAVILEKILDERSFHVSHNRIHRILKDAGLAKNEPRKQKRRRWIRYERRYSDSLWHSDWFEHRKKHVILFEDDASRLITGFGVFNNATAESTVETLDQAIQWYGVPKQLMTDHGTRFTSIPREGCSDPEPNVFQKRLKEYGIKHVKARVKHPQSNGKVEKVIHTLQLLREHFPDWNETIHYYDSIRPHGSLENGKLRTPYQAFIDKSRKSKKKR